MKVIKYLSVELMPDPEVAGWVRSRVQIKTEGKMLSYSKMFAEDHFEPLFHRFLREAEVAIYRELMTGKGQIIDEQK